MSGHTNHIVAYVRQQYVSTWKHITFNYDPGGQPAYFYGSNDCSHFTRLKPGDVLWVIQSHKEDPPSLVARLKIKDIFFDVVMCFLRAQ
jgi:hypothetical protein